MKNHLIKYTLLFFLIGFIFTSPFKLIIVQGESMYPTLKNKQILLGLKTDKFERGDIVVANFEENMIIKRIKYLEGDEIYYLLNSDNQLPSFITKDFYEHYEKHDRLEMVQKLIVDKNQVFLLGDNSEVSDDSRRFGCLSINSIKYKIIYPRL